ncbi:MAG: hypothetical protein IT366_00835 [Candidatus Hydrogenedentes bacterium]|nr:hypothetical protein [Candidatus Hydrogenedentota bacterium]
MNARKVVPALRKREDTVAHKRFRSKSSKIARVRFAAARMRLLDVNRWSDYARFSNFQLVDESGNAVHKHAEEGLLVRINTPELGPRNGETYDWVVIESITYDNEDTFVGVRVRPTHAPGKSEQEISHLNTPDSSNNFTLERKNNLIIAKVIGCKAVTNTEHSSFVEKIRHLTTSQVAWLGGSTTQWEVFLEGIVNGRESDP